MPSTSAGDEGDLAGGVAVHQGGPRCRGVSINPSEATDEPAQDSSGVRTAGVQRVLAGASSAGRARRGFRQSPPLGHHIQRQPVAELLLEPRRTPPDPAADLESGADDCLPQGHVGPPAPRRRRLAGVRLIREVGPGKVEDRPPDQLLCGGARNPATTDKPKRPSQTSSLSHEQQQFACMLLMIGEPSSGASHPSPPPGTDYIEGCICSAQSLWRLPPPSWDAATQTLTVHPRPERHCRRLPPQHRPPTCRPS